MPFISHYECLTVNAQPISPHILFADRLLPSVLGYRVIAAPMKGGGSLTYSAATSMRSTYVPKVLCVYASGQTYTSTVFEHVDSFRKYSRFEWFFLDYNEIEDDRLQLDCFDVIVVHYTVRLPYGQLTDLAVRKLAASSAQKVLFIQDEYDNTNVTKIIIKKAGFNVVFSVVPARSLAMVYPPEEFPSVKFVSNFTGYVPDQLSTLVGEPIPPSQRSLCIAYRGRPLPLRYGKLGMEKVQIGQEVRRYCRERNISHDIAWGEEARIYGDDWYRFVCSARSMLGSESGSNVFDWDGTLHKRTEQFKKRNRSASQNEVYQNVVAPCEIDGLMNQLSPRIFEMAAARTVMVLFEGRYSDVLTPYRHYLPLRKDFKNLDDIFAFLERAEAVDELADTAHRDIILSGDYSYSQFAHMIDGEIGLLLSAADRAKKPLGVEHQFFSVTTEPMKASPPIPSFLTRRHSFLMYWIIRLLYATWGRIPIAMRPVLKRIFKRS